MCCDEEEIRPSETKRGSLRKRDVRSDDDLPRNRKSWTHRKSSADACARRISIPTLGLPGSLASLQAGAAASKSLYLGRKPL